jgi:hypothetical protein
VAVDGSERTRIRFNIKGNRGQVRVWAEVSICEGGRVRVIIICMPLHQHQVSSKMESGEFVYLICQNVRSGRVLTVADRRDDVTSEEADPAAEGSWSLGKYVPFLQK